MKTLFIFLFVLITPLIVIAQSENNVWLFGQGAGLDFSTNPPTAITSPLVALEGTAVLSDDNGDVLFYTNGETIWDKNNNVMPNGSGILGGASSTQAALIVPLGNYCNKYYVFTTEDHEGAGTMRYTLVDLCLNGGLGDVVTTQKNVLLSTNMAEKLTSVLHTNGSDIWVVSHKLESNQFLAFKLSPNGEIAAPVASNVGYSYAWNNMIGPLKASQDGTKLVASTSFNGYSCELLNFNKSTGAITFDQDLMNSGISGGVYGLEFSPNNQLLYIATLWSTSRLYQVNLSNNNVVELSNIPGNYNYGALQTGNDGRIYLARTNMPFLGVINSPNIVGLGCNYIDNGITLFPGTICNAGFPSFNPFTLGGIVQANSNLITDSIANICQGGVYDIDLATECNATVLWNTGSTSSTISISNPGVYTVVVTNVCQILYDTVTVALVTGATASLPQDQNFCTFPVNGYQITPNYQGNLSGSETYLWNNGSVGSSLTAFSPGTYWLQFTSQCGVTTDSIVLTSNAVPVIQQLPLVEVCLNDYPISLNPILSNYSSVVWSDGSTQNALNVSQPGVYTVTATNACGSTSLAIEVVTLSNPTVQLSTDIDTCITVGNFVNLETISTNATNFSWNTTETSPDITVNTSGSYWVSASNICASVSDTMQVTINYLPTITNPINYTVCEDDYPLSVSPIVTNATSISWNDGVLTTQRNIDQPGNYTIYATNNCGIDSLTIEVSTILLPTISLQSTIDTCVANGSSVPLIPVMTNVTTSEWSNGSTINQIQVANSGTYWVIGSNQCGADTSSIVVIINYFPELYLPAILDTCFEIGVGFDYTAQGTGGNYSWSSGSTNATELITQEGLYTCTLTNQCGAVSDSMVVNRMAAIDLYIPKDSLLFCANEVSLSSLGIETNYEMDLSNDQGQGISTLLNETGWYNVHAFNVCGFVDDSIYVDLQNEQYFYLPNSFTPDGDERNPLFIDKGYNYVIEQVEIFNRWGELVYEESGSFSGWDGMYKGAICPDGIYQVHVIYWNCAGIETNFYGHVTVIK